MNDTMIQNDDMSETTVPTFNIDALVSTVHSSFRSPFREQISREDVARIVGELNFSDQFAHSSVPRLRIRRLRFTGEKRFHDGTTAAIDYDQPFASGVNVILIPDNDVGKSSIMKTIKFALTGDNSDYDADVRKWIEAIWLVFALDQRIYTIMLAMVDNQPQAVMVPGEELGLLAQVIETVPYIFHVIGTDQIKAELQSFFFHNLMLKSLSWNQQEPGGHLVERSTTWQTYFQALQIADDGDRYLICDPQHAMGNQDGLILQTFLNLSLADPLNKLGVELSRTKRTAQQEQRISEEEQLSLNDQIAQIELVIQAARQAISTLDQIQQARREAFETSDPVRNLMEVQHARAEKFAEQQQLIQEREGLTAQIKRVRSAARRYQEQAALALHFTGLTVTLCPSCDTPVSAEAVSREQSTHECRLCSTPANTANADEIATLEAEAERATHEVQYLERGRSSITERLGVLRDEIERLDAQIPILKQAVDGGIGHALPSEAENTQREQHFIEVGRGQAEIAALRARLGVRQPDIQSMQARSRILEKVRDVIKEEAARRNAVRMSRLSEMTQEFARQIGAESISDLTCSPLGKIQLRKHGELVSFTGIRNEGERLRIKLAFFTAMMRMGREAGLGRHPGFLLIDQPGSGEMVPDDFRALASIFFHINQHHAEDMQIICFTARPESAEATDAKKLYGAKAPPYAF